MFTGLIEAIGTVRAVARRGAAAELTVELGGLAKELAAGESVSVSGACLTVTAVSGSAATFDCVAETVERTKIRDLRAGSRVNIERALKAGDRLGGHFVTGHVDGLAEVAAVRSSDSGKVMEVLAPGEIMGYVVEKGSVALDGVSLTLASVSDDGFAVALVPFTLLHTTLRKAVPGEKLNVETDLLGKYVKRLLGSPGGGSSGGGLTGDFLAEHGFV